MDSIDRTFKTKFSSSGNLFSKLKFNRTDNVFRPKTSVNPVDKDIYYDEVVYYDGGDVIGYGDDK